jgi:hypothetical protein
MRIAQTHFLRWMTRCSRVVGSGVGTATTTFLHPDHLGGTNVVTDDTGEVLQRFGTDLGALVPASPHCLPR